MSITDDALAALTKAADQAREARDMLDAEMREAENAMDFHRFERASSAFAAAVNAHDLATKRVIAGVMNPEGGNVVSLVEATKKLEKRIAKFKEDAATIADITSVLTILTNAIMLFALV